MADNNLRKILVLLLLLIAGKVSAQELSTQGKVFWMTFMENRLSNTDVTDPEMKIIISTKNANSGTIKNLNSTYVRTFTMTANSVDTFLIPGYAGYTKNSESASDRYKGLVIQTKDTVAVVAQNTKTNTADASLILPIEALGLNYRILSHAGDFTGLNSNYRSAFAIVATEDNTSIEITPSVNTAGGGAANVKFTIILNKGESYQVKAASSKTDLSGTLIQALDCKKIAVFGGSNRSSVIYGNCNPASYDHLYEQMMHIDLWGKKFVVLPTLYAQGKQRKAEMIKVMTNTAGGTSVRCNGRNKILPNAGSWDTFFITKDAIILSARPIAVCQYGITESCDGVGGGGSNTDPFQTWIPPIEQSLKKLSFITVNAQLINKFFTSVIVKTAYTNTLLIDGAAPTASFIPVTFDTSYSYVQQYGLSQGRHTLDCPFGFSAVVYAYGDHSSYGYSAGSSIKPLSISMIVAGKSSSSFELDSAYYTICQGASITFDGQASTPPNSWKWVFSDGYTKGNQKFTRTFNTPGDYTVSMITIRNANGSCNGQSTINDTNKQIIKVFKEPYLILMNDTTICRGNSVNLKSQTNGDTNYVWSPARFLSCTNCFESKSILPDTNMLYFAKATTKGCNPSKDSVFITLRDSLNVNVSKDTTICYGQSINLQAVGTGGLTNNHIYSWDNGLGTGKIKSVKPLITTKYRVILSDGCTSLNDTSFVTVTVRQPLKIKLNADTVICNGNTANLRSQVSGGNGNYTVSWNNGYGNGFSKNVQPNTTTKYRAILKDLCTIPEDTAYINVIVRPALVFTSFTYDSVVCRNTPLSINAKVSGGDSSVYVFRLFNKNNAIDSVKGKSSAFFNPSIKQYKEQFKVSINQTCNNEALSKTFTASIKQNTTIAAFIEDSICNGESFTITAIASNSDGNSMKIKLYKNIGAGYTKIDSTIGSGNINFTVKPTLSTDYMLVADDNCSLADSSYFKLKVLPKAILTPLIDNYICNGSSIPVNIVTKYGKQQQMQYKTTLADGTIVNMNSSFSVSPTETTDYYIEANDNCSPILLDTFRIWVSPIITDSTIYILNNGCEPYSQLFKYPLVKNQTFPTSFIWQWEFGDNTQQTQNATTDQIYPDFTKSYLNPGAYNVKLSLIMPNNKTCKIITGTVNSWRKVVADFDYNPVQIDITEPIVTFNNRSLNADNYLWTFGDGKKSNETDPKYAYTDTGRYDVKLVSSSIHNCNDSIIKTLRVEDIYRIFIPDAFTPNTDGFNEIFTPVATSVQTMEIEIYNRWGEKIYYEKSPIFKWNGNYIKTDSQCEEGVYAYKLTVRDNRKKWHYYSGQINLIR